ncbi:hypothetical protein LS70_005660 [Helicobacter sp. MIT 11-5569]|uniref:hypothetical protein n=1 Tax=Helicobacter sp. MIT 11-5569 TaxID=1548151 RepID=UPI00051FD5A3|nr:hypothetical protein [Helicobacter sp. MIT 11-5569]TLD83234.1 hypothetical protein LS70_005660 [Helicobacter sp. MIT 11-5569]
MQTIELDIFGRNGEFLGKKRFYRQTSSKANKTINDWLREYKSAGETLGILMADAPDFQHNKQIAILNNFPCNNQMTKAIAKQNFIFIAVYFAVRHCIAHTWINDRDQFLYPNHLWEKDSSFQNDCLAFMLFYGQNRITSKEGVNHFIPFSESQVGAKEAFESNFMHRFINGKIKDSKPLDSTFKTSEAKKGNLDLTSKSFLIASSVSNAESLTQKKSQQNLFSNDDLGILSFIPTKPLEFGEEAKEVFKAGLELWKYYHAQEFKDSKNPYNANASLLDIKAHFQGFNDKGKMNPPQKAQDSYYKDLIGNLNFALNNLAQKIEPKIYEYGFLLE